ncbi:hypothetical protein [Actinocrispum wychmicini]|uniref:Uncharacterized protein n=1 Tax=Actinocrispum wychmicini TaxID=1213861 RepID=A0A4R2JKS3_9PSEU|nr:hypothetical protein [Actinocrispum wychmicini]TCO57179.1 hypothetical protein EV192_106656 [Actinocrispum wychmicini]
MSALYVRWKPGEPRESKPLGPLPAEHPAAQYPCLCCGQPLADGRPVQLLAVGPDDDESREKCRAARWHSALALPAHAECLGATTQSDADTAAGTPQPDPVTLYLTRADAGNLEAMVYAGYRALRDDTWPEATAAGRAVLNTVLAAIKPLLTTGDVTSEEAAS